MPTRIAARPRSLSVLITLVAPVVLVGLTVAGCSSGSASRGSRPGALSRVTSAAPTTSSPATTASSILSTPSTTVPPTTTAPPAPTPTVVAGAAPVTLGGVFAIGDSVMLGAAPQLRARGIAVGAAESRQWNTGTSILGILAAAGRLPRVVVVHLGSNGPINGGQIDAMLRVLGGHRVVLMTAHEPRWWQDEVNDTLRAGVARWPGSALLDWHVAGTTHPEWFWNDRIHLRPEGSQAYAALVATAVA